jgi:hypothetical protein
MKIEFQYTSKTFVRRLLMSYLSLVLIGFGTLVFYGPIAPGAQELKYFMVILFGIPLLIFFTGIKKYGARGYMIFNKDTVEIFVHNKRYTFNYLDVSRIKSHWTKGFHVKIRTKSSFIKISASYFADESELVEAFDELTSRIEATGQALRRAGG